MKNKLLSHSKYWLVISFVFALNLIATNSVFAQKAWGCSPEMSDMMLINGEIRTMDSQNSVVSTLWIKDGKIAGTSAIPQKPGIATKVIDLMGHTVIPGLIDDHMHFVRTGLLPGHDTRELETAFTIADAQTVIKKEASILPNGTFITAVGGVHPTQFAEKRWPTLKELDEAAPDNPVYLSQSNTGPGQVNTRAKEYFASLGVNVAADGVISTAETVNIWYKLLAQQNAADTKAQLQNNMDFAASKGMTTIVDLGGAIPDGGWLDPATGYDPLLELMREEQIPIRLRLNLRNLDTTADLSELKGTLDHVWKEFGNDQVKVVGVGEWLIAMSLQPKSPLPEFYEDAVRMVAQRGWIYDQHMINLSQQKAHLDIWEKVNKDIPLANLHWMLAHAYGIDQETILRTKALGVGIGAHSTAYYGGKPAVNGNPPFRMIIDSGIQVGGGSDGARIGVMNPWLSIYYMVTGKNCGGDLINPGQTISREEAIRLWTANQGWFTKEEDKLGSLEAGKFADIAVLSDDVFDQSKVSDEDIRNLRSVLTIVGGNIVHNECF